MTFTADDAWSSNRSPAGLYVGMTPRPPVQHRPRRHRQHRPTWDKPYQQAAPEPVLAAIMHRDDGDLSATEQIRQAQEWSGGTSHLLQLWSAAVRQTLHPDIDEQIKAWLADSEALPVRPRARPQGPAPSGAAPLSSSAMTSAPSSTRSPPRRWTATGLSPASCTIVLQQLVLEIRDEADTIRGLDRGELEA